MVSWIMDRHDANTAPLFWVYLVPWKPYRKRLLSLFSGKVTAELPSRQRQALPMFSRWARGSPPLYFKFATGPTPYFFCHGTSWMTRGIQNVTVTITRKDKNSMLLPRNIKMILWTAFRYLKFEGIRDAVTYNTVQYNKFAYNDPSSTSYNRSIFRQWQYLTYILSY